MNDAELDFNLLEVEKGNKRYGIYIKNEIHNLKQENQRLKEREKKLIKIEEMYKSGSVDLDELYEIVVEEK